VAAPSYPLTLRIEGRRVLVVGGGTVASRRVAALVERGAEVAVVAPWACPPIREAAAAGRLTWEAREFRESDLDGAWLVHTATAHREVDDAVLRAAEARRVWCVKGGDPEAATAWVPATGRVDDVLVAVNAGRDPRRAARLRDRIVAALRAGDLPLRRGRRAGPGWVALVGGGPGADGLLTTRGRRLLNEADVVVVDRLAPHAVLAELDEDVLVVDVGKSAGRHPVPQEQINALLVEHALAGRGVVRLKGGDPYVFGRGGEELGACRRAGVAVEVVPGVTSAVAVPAAVGIPVTHRGVARGFAVLTAHDDVGALPGDPDLTVVLLMGVSRLGAACEGLVRAGRAPGTPVAVVEDGFGPRQRVTLGTLATIADRAAAAGVRPPAVTVVGDVVTLCPAWREAGAAP
jgi:uroporphyrin-III C-methyltransferase/precorrin-2 dehydrogenase/sirohydrochlorin ferrochelatase